MSDPDRMASVLTDVHRAVSHRDLPAALDMVAHLALEAVDVGRWSSVTVLTGDHPSTIAYQGDDALVLDQAQYDADDGPCLHAARSGVEVVVDLAAENRWPTYLATARSLGVGSSLSLPMSSEATLPAALNLYADRPHAFPPEVSARARHIADHGAIAIGNTAALSESERLADQLRIALRTRDIIGQAKGILMAHLRITEDEAFDRLRLASQDRNVKLRDLAEEVTRTGELTGG